MHYRDADFRDLGADPAPERSSCCFRQDYRVQGLVVEEEGLELAYELVNRYLNVGGTTMTKTERTNIDTRKK